jgi:deazaflavin-dependent oxidoreductase (nitroreductase family)
MTTSGVRRTAQRFAKLRPVTLVLSRLLPRLDRVIRRVTKGKIGTAAQLIAPSLVLHSIGAKSGQPRENPLVYAADGDAFVVVGTNFGGQRQPAWTSNLLANPEASVSLDGVTFPVTAHTVTDQGERDRLWALMDDAYVGFASYRRRLADTRAIRMFRLEPHATN